MLPSLRAVSSSGACGNELLHIEGGGRPALLAFDESPAKSLDLHFTLFQQPKSRADHIACQGVSAFADLTLYERPKVVANDDGCILGHSLPLGLIVELVSGAKAGVSVQGGDSRRRGGTRRRPVAWMPASAGMTSGRERACHYLRGGMRRNS